MARGNLYQPVTVPVADPANPGTSFLKILGNVRVTVRPAGSTTTTVPIFTSRNPAETVSMANPFTTSDGMVNIYAEYGEYDVYFEDLNSPARFTTQKFGWSSAPGQDIPGSLISKDGGIALASLSALIPAAFVARGLLADRPDAASVSNGIKYYATDDHGGTTYRSQGSNWERVSRSVPVRTPGGTSNFATTTGANFTVDGGTYLIIASTSAICNVSTGGTANMGVIWQIDGVDVTTVTQPSPPNQGARVLMPPAMMIRALGAGQHSINARNGGLTAMDTNDRGSFIVIETV